MTFIIRILLIFLIVWLLISLAFGFWALIASDGNLGAATGMFFFWWFMLIWKIGGGP